MTGQVRLDAAALDGLAARQREVAQALADCARHLEAPRDWAHTPAHRAAAAALDGRLHHLAGRLRTAGDDVSGLADRMLAHAAALSAADAEAVR
ncbi:hypothetical protein [Gordonia caeni]|uniref:ESX-1 secretion-associated protein n=1 Tax=Gordonia caeni TaxID=1007097 RepID=A0ABP7PHL6_9ACTN